MIGNRVAVVVANVDYGNIAPADSNLAADFELAGEEGKDWRLVDHLSRGPVVLVFYRGDW